MWIAFLDAFLFRNKFKVEYFNINVSIFFIELIFDNIREVSVSKNEYEVWLVYHFRRPYCYFFIIYGIRGK